MLRFVALVAAVCAASAQDPATPPLHAEAEAVGKLRSAVESVAGEVEQLLGAISGDQARSIGALATGATGIARVSSEVQAIQHMVTQLAVDSSISAGSHQQIVSLVSDLQEIVNGLFDMLSAHVDRVHGHMQAAGGQGGVAAALDDISAKVGDLVAASADSASQPAAGSSTPEAAPAEQPVEQLVRLPGYLAPERVSHVADVVRSAMWLHWQEIQNKEKLERTRRQQQWLDQHEGELGELEDALRAKERHVAELRARVAAAEERIFARKAPPAAPAAAPAAAAAQEEAAAPAAAHPAPADAAAEPEGEAAFAVASRSDGPAHEAKEAADKARRAKEMNKAYLRDKAARAAHLRMQANVLRKVRAAGAHVDQQEGGDAAQPGPAPSDAGPEAPEAAAVAEGEEGAPAAAATAATGARGKVSGGSAPEREAPKKGPSNRNRWGPDYYVAARALADLPAEQLRVERESKEEARRHLVLHAMQDNPDGTVAPMVVADLPTHMKEHRSRVSGSRAPVTAPLDATEPEREPTLQVERVRTRAERAKADAAWRDVAPQEVSEEQLAAHQLEENKGWVVAKTAPGAEEETVAESEPTLSQPMPAFREMRAGLRARARQQPAALEPTVLLEEAPEATRTDPSEPLAYPYKMPNPRDFGAADESDMEPWMNDADDQPPLPELPQ